MLMPVSAAILLGFVLEIASNSSHVTKLAIEVYPQELHGIWFGDDRDGRARCRAFLAADISNADAKFERLTGSEAISSNLWHSVSEYGEGNFYKLRRISKTGAHSWRIEADVGIDFYPDGPESQRAKFDVKIAKRKLLWSDISLDDRFGRKNKEQRFFRCSAVPAYFRRYR